MNNSRAVPPPTYIYVHVPQYNVFLPCTQSDHWHFIDDGPLFDNLESCIDHYMIFPDGLPTMLRHPVSPSGKSMATPVHKVWLPCP